MFIIMSLYKRRLYSILQVKACHIVLKVMNQNKMVMHDCLVNLG